MSLHDMLGYSDGRCLLLHSCLSSITSNASLREACDKFINFDTCTLNLLVPTILSLPRLQLRFSFLESFQAFRLLRGGL